MALGIRLFIRISLNLFELSEVMALFLRYEIIFFDLLHILLNKSSQSHLFFANTALDNMRTMNKQKSANCQINGVHQAKYVQETE